MFVDCAEALHGVLPHSTVLRLPGLNHDLARPYGKPETIAARCLSLKEGRLLVPDGPDDLPGHHGSEPAAASQGYQNPENAPLATS
jgi:hypothetical protein